MPVVEGSDVHGLLQRDGPMSPPRAVAVIEQLAAALTAAHGAGLVHRDVKPSNALMTADDFVYLIDFGIAHDSTATRLTNTGMMIGTFAYMAPERFGTGAADARGDVYALACVLHECLTGATPFPGDSVEQQIAGHLTLDPPRPSSIRPAIAPAFDRVIATGMAKDPGQRYQSARELAAAARQAVAGGPHPAGDQRLSAATRPLGLRPTEPTMQGTQQYSDWSPGAPAALAGWPGSGQADQPAPRSNRNQWLTLGVAALVVVAALGIAGIYLGASGSGPTVATSSTARTSIATSAALAPAGAPAATTSAVAATPSTAAELPGLAPFVGIWRAHMGILTIRPNNSGHFAYTDIRACPTCSTADAPAATVDFTLTSVSGSQASGNVDASSDEQNLVVGAPISAQLTAGYTSGQILQLNAGRVQMTLCNDTSVGQCGA